MEKRKEEPLELGEKKENLQVPCEEKTSDVRNSCWTLLQPDVPNDHRLLESRSLTTQKDVGKLNKTGGHRTPGKS